MFRSLESDIYIYWFNKGTVKQEYQLSSDYEGGWNSPRGEYIEGIEWFLAHKEKLVSFLLSYFNGEEISDHQKPSQCPETEDQHSVYYEHVLPLCRDHQGKIQLKSIDEYGVFHFRCEDSEDKMEIDISWSKLSEYLHSNRNLDAALIFYLSIDTVAFIKYEYE